MYVPLACYTYSHLSTVLWHQSTPLQLGPDCDLQTKVIWSPQAHPGSHTNADQGDVIIPSSRTTQFSQRSFCSLAPTVWNDLPSELKNHEISKQCFLIVSTIRGTRGKSVKEALYKFTDWPIDLCWSTVGPVAVRTRWIQSWVVNWRWSTLVTKWTQWKRLHRRATNDRWLSLKRFVYADNMANSVLW